MQNLAAACLCRSEDAAHVLGEMEHHAMLCTSAIQVSSSLQSTPQAPTLQGNETTCPHRWWCFVKKFSSRAVCTENIWGICSENKGIKNSEPNWEVQRKEGEQRARHMERRMLSYLGEEQVSHQLRNSGAALLLKVRLSKAVFLRPRSFSWGQTPAWGIEVFFQFKGKKKAILKCCFDWVCIIQYPALVNVQYT